MSSVAVFRDYAKIKTGIILVMIDPIIITETPEYWVLNKPPQMATEPPSHLPTLKDWLIKHKHINPQEWAEGDRLGVVQRLDTDTSGVVIWAKTKDAQEHLRKLWRGRAVKKNYLALIRGNISKNGSIEYPIMRDNQKDRQKVAIFPNPKARVAITTYERIKELAVGSYTVSLIRAQPITGRTHQIRVHLKSIGNPIIGDKLYADKKAKEIASILGLDRQFLHAESIEIEGKKYQAELPDDLRRVLKRLEVDF